MKNKILKTILKASIKWAENQEGCDVFYIFDNPDDAIERFLNDYDL